MKKVIFSIFLIILISGCAKTSNEGTAKELAIDACKAECQKSLQEGTDLSNGPCLSNKVIDDWVCDIAHSPREEVDNQVENQCPNFGSGAHHFVELDKNCNLIKTW